jgi:hypothetical protein
MLDRLARDRSWIDSEEYHDLAPSEKAVILDAYLDYAQYVTLKKEKRTDVIDENTRKILIERSRLGRPIKDQIDLIPFSSPPELGHGSARISTGVGKFESEFFEQLSLRPAYHDLLAKDTGYSRDSQMVFLDLNLRYYNDSNRTRLDSLKLVDIISLTPYDPLFKRKSWKLSIGVDKIEDINCDHCNSFKGNYGIGLGVNPGYPLPMLFYTLIDFEAEFSSRLGKGYRLGGGATTGVLFDITDHWRVQLLGDYLRFPLGDRSGYYKVAIHQRYAILQDLDVRVDLRRVENKKEWLFSMNYYF